MVNDITEERTFIRKEGQGTWDLFGGMSVPR